MRVPIIEKMSGTLDGIDLTKFEVGHVYEVGATFGNYLLASRYAAPVSDEQSAGVVPLDHAVDRRHGKRRA